jgi:ATP-dependent RNA helicase DeaD
VEQLAIFTDDRAKQPTIMELVRTQQPFLAVIFCRTKRRVSKLYGVLKSNGFLCDELHGDISQAKREQVMKRFRKAKTQLLIATDVAARGLDVEGVSHVYNYDIPEDTESYVHRIGRTGRAGTTGTSITLYTTEDRDVLQTIEKDLDIRIDKMNIGNLDLKEGTNNQEEPIKQIKKKFSSANKSTSRSSARREKGETARKDTNSRKTSEKNAQRQTGGKKGQRRTEESGSKPTKKRNPSFSSDQPHSKANKNNYKRK